MKTSESLDKIDISVYFVDKYLFSCWYDKYLLLKSFCYKLFCFFHDKLCEVKKK